MKDSSQISSFVLNSSQPILSQDGPAYSDDLEMTDTGLLHPGLLHADSFHAMSERVPTPIDGHFSANIRSTHRIPSYLRSNEPTFDEDDNEHNNGPRRLPSPISEDEPSPSIILEGLGDVQMGDEEERPNPTPPKMWHSRSRHNLRDWDGNEPDESGPGVKKAFSMGYRSDCEKCRLKLPGHYSHVVTY